MGKSVRTVRAQVARGELPGKKVNGRWYIPRHGVPLTETQRRGVVAKADAVRQAVDAVLPSSLPPVHGQRSRSIADLEAFQRGLAVLTGIRQTGAKALAEEARSQVDRLLTDGLRALSEAVQQYDPGLKIDAVNRARTGFAGAVALLLVEGGVPPRAPMEGWVVTLEAEVLPRIAGFARWAEKLQRSS